MTAYDPATDSARSYEAAIAAKRARGDTTWKKPLPEYSPAMLRLHLIARAKLARDLRRQTEKQYVREAARLSGVKVHVVRLALEGRLRKAEPRVRLWAALGHFPGLIGIVLTDDGGQHHG
ncbi:MAG TPA: hypothetical protein VGV39_04730 [Mesorhizobium sp.]|jgi:hypothetical protein|uniref:hypothetical protein n=1 Tax=Mesorhizobium sp. TaxID=1871066 RepID=UPI002DDCE002|nr:hypothetical protein [Mesorhizobium sp.]HEV2502354.1 hypothetical protein [Mesorhizobium sp.]